MHREVVIHAHRFRQVHKRLHSMEGQLRAVPHENSPEPAAALKQEFGGSATCLCYCLVTLQRRRERARARRAACSTGFHVPCDGSENINTAEDRACPVGEGGDVGWCPGASCIPVAVSAICIDQTLAVERNVY